MASFCRSAAAAGARSAALRSRSPTARPFLAATYPLAPPRLNRSRTAPPPPPTPSESLACSRRSFSCVFARSGSLEAWKCEPLFVLPVPGPSWRRRRRWRVWSRSFRCTARWPPRGCGPASPPAPRPGAASPKVEPLYPLACFLLFCTFVIGWIGGSSLVSDISVAGSVVIPDACWSRPTLFA
jgi:hypothetical protein